MKFKTPSGKTVPKILVYILIEGVLYVYQPNYQRFVVFTVLIYTALIYTADILLRYVLYRLTI